MTVSNRSVVMGHLLCGDQNRNGIAEYLSGGDYSLPELEAWQKILFDWLKEEVDRRLPEGVLWNSQYSELIYPHGAPSLEREEVVKLMEEAWTAVEKRHYDAGDTIPSQA